MGARKSFRLKEMLYFMTVVTVTWMYNSLKPLSRCTLKMGTFYFM